MSEATKVIAVDQLRPGIFISLGKNWLEHPFMFSQFRISSEKQIETLKQLGIREIVYVPEKSTVDPLPAAELPVSSAPVKAELSPEQIAAMEEKHRRMEIMKAKKAAIAKCEKAYVQSGTRFKNIMQNLFSRPAESGGEAKELVDEIVGSFMDNSDVIIHLMGDKVHEENAYYHALNVLILSMLLAKQLKLDAEQMKAVGLGALFHDIGKVKVPDAILRKKEPLNQSEMAFYQLHVQYGVQLAQEIGIFPKKVVEVIRQHHEALDGSGYPMHASGDEIGIASRIVALANAYDNLCNPPRLEASRTPYEAMSQLFAKESSRYDIRMLKIFVSCMGVYPPGSIVELSNETFGMAISVNQSNLLKPSVLIYDRDIPKNEAIIIDLAETPDLSIVKCIRPQQLPEEVFAYLNPRKSVRYYFESK